MRIEWVALAGALFGLTAAPVMAQSGVKAGLLSCRTGPSVGLIVGSHQRMHCRFDPDGGGPSEAYSGAITRVGLDVGIRAGGVMGWGVYAPSSAAALASRADRPLRGASGDASLGVGAGGKLLVGGSHHTVSLQPLALSG
jgi:hypothetical protein